jgi:hypothetical protein
MKLNPSVAAVLLAFSATGAWAGSNGTDQSRAYLGGPNATAVQPSAGPANDTLEWKFVSGKAAPWDKEKYQNSLAATEGADDSNQAAVSDDQSAQPAINRQ